MVEFNQVKIKRILNPTSIDLGEYVINPFLGCAYACLYCYVRSNRVISRKNKPWGEYVDIRVNAPELLEKELAAKKPKIVLLGSTTECFQPIGKEHALIAKILEVLNRHKVYYVILSRSPLITDHIALLKEGFCKKVYFSVNNMRTDFKRALEPRSPLFESRYTAVNKLLDEGIPVVPYFSPVLPWISQPEDIFAKFPQAGEIEFECLNFNLVNINDIINSIAGVNPALRPKYTRMLGDKIFYGRIWQEFKDYIEKRAKIAKKRYNIYIHEFGGYFRNSYVT
jgi:DNA repair photolyase